MGDGRWAMGNGRWAMGDGQWAMRTKWPWTLSNIVSSPIELMRTRQALAVSIASAMMLVAPSLIQAQRNSRSCYSTDARSYADCRYDVERSRAVQREAIRERAEQRRERVRWDGIVRQARAQARAYDMAERSRQRSAERVARQRAERERVARDRIDRDRVRFRRY